MLSIWKSLNSCCLVKVNSFPKDKFWDQTKLKISTDNNVNVSKMTISVFDGIKNRRKKKHCGKRRKCWLPAFSPYPTRF